MQHRKNMEICSDILKKMSAVAEKVKFSAHCHDDLGMAVANSLAAIENGADQIECTINGIGERAGNASLEEIAVALHIRKDFYQAETGINLKEIKRTSQLVSRLTGFLYRQIKRLSAKTPLPMNPESTKTEC